MHPVAGQNDHHNEIRDEQRQVKAVGRIEALEGLIQKLALEIVDQPPLRIGKEPQRESGTNVQRQAPTEQRLKSLDCKSSQVKKGRITLGKEILSQIGANQRPRSVEEQL